MSRSGKRKISSEEAIADILDFVNDENDSDGENDLFDLLGDEDIRESDGEDGSSENEEDDLETENRVPEGSTRRIHRRKSLT